MKHKTAIIYDKWLSSLGGGEVVACNMAKILSEMGYQVVFIGGKNIDTRLVRTKLNIDIPKVKFIFIWNNETAIKSITKNKDIFINISFMDYSNSLAQKNIYYAHFPTAEFTNIRSFIKNKIILPIISSKIKPIEFVSQPLSTFEYNGRLLHQIGQKLTFSNYNLNVNTVYQIKFFVYLEQFNKSNLEKISISFSGGTLIHKCITIDHRHNIIKFLYYMKANSNTIVTTIRNLGYRQPDKICLIDPNSLSEKNFIESMKSKVFGLIISKLRSGQFANVKRRIDQFQSIACHSRYVAKWINKYWQRKAKVIYPPIRLLFQIYQLNKYPKENIICSVGRFFTLGHSKKQHIMIQAFKLMYNSGIKNWSLWLAGGLSDEPTSIGYFSKLQKMSKGYPIYFLVNKPQNEIDNLYLKSKIYWHAAGYGENKQKDPIKFEHFGITAVEAVSAGCIPILFNGGGLPEIINILNLSKTDYLFDNIQDLVTKTKLALNHSKFQLNKKTQNALIKHFSFNSFKNNIKYIISS